MSRYGTRHLAQRIMAASQRYSTKAPPIALGTIVSFNKTDHTIVAKVDYGDGFAFTTTPSQLMVPWHGADSGTPYGEGGGPEEGQQCVVATLDADTDLYLILGFTPFDDATGIGVPAGEQWTVDKRGSFSKFVAARGGALRHFAAGFATIFGGTATEVGGENLDATDDAIIRKSDLDQALSDQIAQLKTDLTAWAAASLMGGSGAGGPSPTAITSTGSSVARAAP